MRNKRKEKKVQFEITNPQHFVDGVTSFGFGPGIWSLYESDADRLQAQGRGRRLDGKQTVTAPEANTLPVDPEASGTKVEPDTNAAQALPEDFPERALLVANGFDTIESLCVEGIKDKLSAIAGMGPAKLNKIALRLGDTE